MTDLGDNHYKHTRCLDPHELNSTVFYNRCLHTAQISPAVMGGKHRTVVATCNVIGWTVSDSAVCPESEEGLGLKVL